MKKLTFILLLIPAAAFSQHIDAGKVPKAAQTTFGKDFQGVEHVKWDKEKGNFEANFIQGTDKMSALFDASGKLLETETAIAVNTLPANARTYIEKHYKGNIKEAARIKMPNGEINYEAEIKGTDVIFDAKGTFIKTDKE